MTDSQPVSTGVARAASFEDAVAELETAWRAGSPPWLLDYANVAPDLLAELCLVDMELRWRAAVEAVPPLDPLGPRPTLRDYARLLPQVEPILTAPHAIGEEFHIRAKWGDSPGEADLLILYGNEPALRAVLAKVRAQLDADAGEAAMPRGPQRAAEPAHASLLYSDYRLERLLGRGGMGKVYLATHRSRARKVVVKSLLKSRQSSRRSVEQLLHEARVLARLRHPQIVGFHGLGQFPAGGYFLVMDYVDGQDLQVRLTNGPLPEREALRLFRPIGAAIEYAHSQGVLHGDLKPANVLISSDGTPVVVDFGLARWLESDDVLRAKYFYAGGTQGFAPPELFAQHGAPASVATDVYSLAALLHAMVTGDPPLHGQVLALDQRTTGLARALQVGLAYAARDRFPTVREFLAALPD